MNNTIISTKALSGFLELLPEEQIVFNDLMEKIVRIYKSFGFYPLDTPLIERDEVLFSKTGGETQKQIYRLQKEGLSLRFDLTVPLARYVSEYEDKLSFPFKRYQIGKVYRGERAQKGRFREFYQCDVDIISNNLPLINDALIISMIYQVMTALDIGDFKIFINNRKILKGFLEYLNVQNHDDILRLIDKKISRETLRDELGKVTPYSNEVIGFFDAGIDEISIKHKLVQTGIDELKHLFHYLDGLGVPEKNYSIDLSIVRGLDYYTGSIFETFLTGNEDLGSVCSGGRYDNLTSLFSDKQFAGVGMSIGLTRLFSQLKEKKILKFPKKTLVDVVLFCNNKTKEVEFFELYKELQKNLIVGELFLEGELKEKLRYANKLEIPFVIFAKEGIMSFKDMTNGNQKDGIKIEEIIFLVKEKKEWENQITTTSNI